jgi:hypothetical protein
MIRKFKVYINYDRNDPVELMSKAGNGIGNYMVPWLIEEALKRHKEVEVIQPQDYRDDMKLDMILNSMPMDPIPFLKAKGGITALWDLEECSDPKRKYFDQCDIIFHPNYNPYRWDLYPVEKSSYLPLANDFIVSRYFSDEPFVYDVSFLGREELEIYQYRRDILDALDKEFKICRGTRPRGEPSSRIISQGRLTVQVSGWDNLEERFFQNGAIRPMLVDYLEEIDLVADRDKDYISYTSLDECLEKVRYYLKHMDEAEVIGNNLIEKIKKFHTYDNRADEIVRILKGGKLDKRGQYLWNKAKGLPKKIGYE